MPSKTEGQSDSMMGKIKETVGGLMGNDKMEAEGAARHNAGEGQVNAAKTENRMDAAGKDIKGHVKDAIGGMTGDHSMQAEGKADKARADVGKAANQF